uniref:Uncharacterized protein n=1 Tax=Spongospora subterranea TaxID=70186 RepID=A0A0H5QU38_9EUKA|eukprot:CRZ05247.1 hypothetical protein [Spongospora subterranea]
MSNSDGSNKAPLAQADDWGSIRQNLLNHLSKHPQWSSSGKECNDFVPEICRAQSQTLASLRTVMDQVSRENTQLQEQLSMEKSTSTSLRSELEDSKEKYKALLTQYDQAVNAKELCLKEIQNHDTERQSSQDQRQTLADALESLRVKTAEMENVWKNKETHWSQSSVRQEQQIRDLMNRLTEANRLLKSRTGAGHYKESMEEAQNQIRLLRRRLRAEQLHKVRDDLNLNCRGEDETHGESQSIEMLSLKRDNVRLTVKVRTLEERLSGKTEELNGFSSQLREVQGLLHSNLSKQSHAVIESKSFEATIKKLQFEIEARLQEIEDNRTEIARLNDELNLQRADLEVERTEIRKERDRNSTLLAEIERLKSQQANNEKRLEMLQPMKQALVEIAKQRDKCQENFEVVEKKNQLLLSKSGSIQVQNDDLAKQLSEMSCKVAINQQKVETQTRWFNDWKTDIQGLGEEFTKQMAFATNLRLKEVKNISELKLKLAQTEKALHEQQIRNSKIDGVLQRLIYEVL